MDENLNSNNVSCSNQPPSNAMTVSAPATIREPIIDLRPNRAHIYEFCAKGSGRDTISGGLRQFNTEFNTAAITVPSLVNIGQTSFSTQIEVTSGENIDVWFFVASASGPQRPVCRSSQFDGIGPHSVGDIVNGSAAQLLPGTEYIFRACAMAADLEVFSTPYVVFRTDNPNVPVLPCSSGFFRGNSAGLSVTFDLGNQGGISNYTFDAFQIPDRLQIFEHGTNRILSSTAGFVSGVNRGQFSADGIEQVDIVVTPNVDARTEYTISMECPR